MMQMWTATLRQPPGARPSLQTPGATSAGVGRAPAAVTGRTLRKDDASDPHWRFWKSHRLTVPPWRISSTLTPNLTWGAAKFGQSPLRTRFPHVPPSSPLRLRNAIWLPRKSFACACEADVFATFRYRRGGSFSQVSRRFCVADNKAVRCVLSTLLYGTAPLPIRTIPGHSLKPAGAPPGQWTSASVMYGPPRCHIPISQGSACAEPYRYLSRPRTECGSKHGAG